MSIASEALNRLEMEWIPKPVLGGIRQDLASLDVNGEPLNALTSLRQKIETSGDADTRIQHLQLRMIHATARALARTDNIDWNEVLKAIKDPKGLLEIFYTLNFSRFSVSRPSQLQQEYGKKLRIAIHRKFGGHDEFHCQLIGALERDQADFREQREHNKVVTSREIERGIAASKTPQSMRECFRSLGLPGDCYRNKSWTNSLWRSQRSMLRNTLKQVSMAIEGDERFKEHDFNVWMEPHRSTQRWFRSNPQSWELLGQARKRASVKQLPPEVEGYVDKIIRKYPHDKIPDEQYALLFPFERTDGPNPWAQLCSCIDPTGRDATDVEWAGSEQTAILVHVLGDLLWSFDKLTACERIDWCDTPQDFLQLFQVLGLREERWKDKTGLASIPTRPKNLSGMVMDHSDLVYAIELRFGDYNNFIDWMEAKGDRETNHMQQVRSCRSANAFRKLCKELGVPNDHWKSESWMLHRSQFPMTHGGIGKDLSAIVDGIEEHPYLEAFNLGDIRTYRGFVSAVDDSMTSMEQAWDVIYKFCERFGMSIADLLRTSNDELIQAHPDLYKAISYLYA